MDYIIHYFFCLMLIVTISRDLKVKNNKKSEIGDRVFEAPFKIKLRLCFFALPVMYIIDVIFMSDFSNMIGAIQAGILFTLASCALYIIVKFLSIRDSIYTHGLIIFETVINWESVLSYRFEETRKYSFLKSKTKKKILVLNVRYIHAAKVKDKNIKFDIPYVDEKKIRNIMELNSIKNNEHDAKVIT